MPVSSSGLAPEEASLALKLLKSGKLNVLLGDHGWVCNKQSQKGGSAGTAGASGKGKGAGIRQAGWVQAGKKQPQDAKKPQPDVLIQTGFSVEVRDGVEQLLARGGGVCLGSSKDTERALA